MRRRFNGDEDFTRPRWWQDEAGRCRDRPKDGRSSADPPRLPAPDNHFAQLSRLIYKIIKVCHHLDNVSPIDGGRGPLMIRHTVNHLCTLIRTAIPNPTTMLALEGNARQWGVIVLEILEQHYSECLISLLDQVDIQELRDWQQPFQVATRWAKRNLSRLQQTSIDRAKRLICTDTV